MKSKIQNPQSKNDPAFGVRIAGVGSAVPDKVLTNFDLEKLMDTSDEWIVQRTGIRERRIVDPKHEGTFTLGRDALRRALADAGMEGKDLDLIIFASVTAEMTCPSNACRVALEIGATPAGAFDLVAACCGYVYALNVGESMVRSGRYQRVGIIGCDAMSTICDYTERSVSILFGDAAGAAILTRNDGDPSVGCLYQSLNADASMWESLYIPRRCQEIPDKDRENPIRMGCLRMNGREVYKFAVTKFREVIEDALAKSGLTPDQISQFICHQSNVRIIDAAKERMGLSDDRVYVNIDRFGNSSAGSIGLCFDQLWQSGRVKRGDHVVFVAFGGGLTWASSVWKL
ncbi:MAG: ketoacyl-ACP synthase III [Phycisphaerales bacterium]|nr:ketoacyl-ACP synthase III [Phycisphaerales bacterium]MCI0632238.1 ketoacyl-ACP synthase III [Phycisphaerales bacterium]MCI0676279.1 ketoacyl-ACP synthase III [Phycisphaerales bacterium]